MKEPAAGHADSVVDRPAGSPTPRGLELAVRPSSDVSLKTTTGGGGSLPEGVVNTAGKSKQRSRWWWLLRRTAGYGRGDADEAADEVARSRVGVLLQSLGLAGGASLECSSTSSSLPSPLLRCHRRRICWTWPAARRLDLQTSHATEYA